MHNAPSVGACADNCYKTHYQEHHDMRAWVRGYETPIQKYVLPFSTRSECFIALTWACVHASLLSCDDILDSGELVVHISRACLFCHTFLLYVRQRVSNLHPPGVQTELKRGVCQKHGRNYVTQTHVHAQSQFWAVKTDL